MPGRPKGSKNGDVEQRWYDVFCAMPAEERCAALRILEMNHRAILVAEDARQPRRPQPPAEKPPATLALMTNGEFELSAPEVIRRAARNGEAVMAGEFELSTPEELTEARKLEGGK